jgi:Limiting CO2-inducible proteins B/C beta carbonyic anhydrases
LLSAFHTHHSSFTIPFFQTEKIATSFPGALPNNLFVDNLSDTLKEYGFYKRNTLLATSLCCDEVNRELEQGLKKNYGDHFSMGGLAGFPFGGVTAFGAMAHHIPNNGHCVVIFGPHVGVDNDGVFGKVNRRGRAESGACCGSATAAAAYVSGVHKGTCPRHNPPTEALDAQQTHVGNLLLPHAERLDLASEPTVELPKALYDAQKELMDCIVAKGCGEVAGDGMIALVGGIQINTPPGFQDYFVPLSFDLLDNKGNIIADLIVNIQLDRADDEIYLFIALAVVGFIFIWFS